MPLTFSLILKEVQWVYLKFYTIEIIFERSRNVFKQLVNWHKMVLQPQRTHQCVYKIRLKDSSTNCQTREDEVQPLLVDLGSSIIPVLDLRSWIILPTPRSQAHVQAVSRREFKISKNTFSKFFNTLGFKYFCTNPIYFMAESSFKHVM